MAFEREQEAYELTASAASPGLDRSRTASLVAAADASAQRPSEASRDVVDDTNSDHPISDDQAKAKGKDGKEQQAGMGHYFVSFRLLLRGQRELTLV